MPEEKESEKNIYIDNTDIELEQIDEEIKQKEKELSEEEKNSPKCFISSKIESLQTKKTDSKAISEKKRSIDPTLMKSSESQIKSSLNFEDLNVEEESKFLGVNPSKSKIKDLSSDSESSIDDMEISGFNKSLIYNQNLVEMKKKTESSFMIKKSNFMKFNNF